MIVALAAGLVVPPAALRPWQELPIVQRMLARIEPPPDQFRALRVLEAENDHFHQRARMVVWTEADRLGGFRYNIVSEDGSAYIRSRVFRAALEAESRMWANGEPQRAAVSLQNYEIEDRGVGADGLASLAVRPRRKDVLLVDGMLFVTQKEGDIVRIEGRLSKTPSFWTRRVEVVRRYERIGGVHVPVSLESVAHVLIAGRSTFRMTYEYESINGEHVAHVVPPPPASRE